MLYVSCCVRFSHRIPETCVRMQKELLYTCPSRVPYVSYAKVCCYHDNIIIVL